MTLSCVVGPCARGVSLDPSPLFGRPTGNATSALPSLLKPGTTGKEDSHETKTTISFEAKEDALEAQEALSESEACTDASTPYWPH